MRTCIPISILEERFAGRSSDRLFETALATLPRARLTAGRLSYTDVPFRDIRRMTAHETHAMPPRAEGDHPIVGGRGRQTSREWVARPPKAHVLESLGRSSNGSPVVSSRASNSGP